MARALSDDRGGPRGKAWAQSLAVAELLTATYGEWSVAEWVRSSVQSHFRANELDIAAPAVARAVRSYVYSGLIACFALDRLLDESAPDVLLLFNGRQSSTRVALEIALARDVRVVVHERGPRDETLMLVENATCLSLDYLRTYWREWGDVPLSPDELDDVARLMAEREHGRDTGWTPFTAAPQPLAEVRAALGLRAVHPNTGSPRSQGANRVQLEQMRRLAVNLPPNVRMIDPDDEISSYSVMDLCSVGLVWVSTVGLELACKGKNVVIRAGNAVAGTSFVHTVEDAATYGRLLESLLALPLGTLASEQVRRLSLRFAYGLFFRLPVSFPLREHVDAARRGAAVHLSRRLAAWPRRRRRPLRARRA